MAIRYFKPETLVGTCCEHCGTQRKETLARLYSNDKLVCAACGMEHTAERDGLRQSLDETEAWIDRVPAWTGKLFSWLQVDKTGRNP